MVQVSSVTANVEADSLYLPRNMQPILFRDTSIHCEPQGAAFVARRGTDRANNKIFYIEKTAEDCVITLPVVYYGYLTVCHQENGEYFKTQEGYNRQLAVALDEGFTGTILVSYQMPWSWKAAYIVSLTFAASVGFYLVLGRRLKPRRLINLQREEVA